MIILPLLLAAAAAPPADAAAGDDIVVTAKKAECEIKFEDKTLAGPAFDARAQEWAAGRPVRVIARANADVPCLSKIAFRLADRGVRRITFVDPLGRPAEPFVMKVTPRPAPTATAAPSAAGAPPAGAAEATTPFTGRSDIRAIETGLIENHVAQLIIAGRCDEAVRDSLKEGRVMLAAAVLEVCRATKPAAR